MKKFALCFSICCLLFSCAPKVIPLKGEYGKPYILNSNSTFVDVWDKIIDKFSHDGIGIKLIDRSSGLIIAQNTNAVLTTEDKYGKIKDTLAWGVTEKIYDPGSRKTYYAKEGTIEWNIHLKSNKDSTTNISINLIDIATVTSVYSVGWSTVSSTKNYKARTRSTGVFERLLAEQIK